MFCAPSPPRSSQFQTLDSVKRRLYEEKGKLETGPKCPQNPPAIPDPPAGVLSGIPFPPARPRLSPLPQQAHGSASPGRGGGGVGVEVVWSSAPKSCADTEIRCCSGPG